MAKTYPYPQRHCFRTKYTITLDGKKVERAQYAKDLIEGRLLERRLTELERATRTGIASQQDIEDWISRKWLKPAEAETAFLGYTESAERKRRHNLQGTDYDRLEQACIEYSRNVTQRSGGADRNHQTYLSQFRHALTWLRRNIPCLDQLTAAAVERYKGELASQFAPWTAFHRLTKLRIALDQAQRLRMVADNVARQVPLDQPQRRQIPRILTLEEIQWSLQASLAYRSLINGSLPTAVRMGLYAGLRDIEMIWFSWNWMDWNHRVINIGETVCEVTGQSWIPKTHEARALDVKAEFVNYLKEERQRQQAQGLLNQFVLPAGGNMNLEKCKLTPRQVETIRAACAAGSASRAQLAAEHGVSWNMINDIVHGRKWKPSAGPSPYLGKPLQRDAPQKAFHKMMQQEGKIKKAGGKNAAEFTLYSLRHTYITRLLLPPNFGGAGLDVRTVQKRAGHKSISTTEQYLRDIEVLKHATDGLPY
jgi:site-specific recombinase XerD